MKKIISIFFLITIVFLSAYVYVAYFLTLSLSELPSSLVIVDTHSEEIGEVVANESIRHREMGFSDIPHLYLSGIVWLEDRDFWQNDGISMRGIVRSIVHNFQEWKIVEWASTLSAQYIRNALWINESRDLKHKILESLYAIRLNHISSKEAILTSYINRIGFWYLNYGLKSASFYYFGKEPKNLTEAEQIALLVIPKNPNTYDPYKNQENFLRRYDTILSTLESWGIISTSEAKNIKSEQLAFRSDHRSALPYVVDYIKQNNKKLTKPLSSVIRTTVDASLTARIDTISRSLLDELSWRNVSDYGILIAERSPSGPVLRVMIGGKDYHESNEGQVNTTLSLRQPWSTLKPFTYILAFEHLWLTPESTITDLPVNYKTAEWYSYEPKNYSQNYQWEVTLRESLSQSINIPAVKILEKIGTDTLLLFLRSVWITSLDQTSDYYWLALTLWDGEVTLFELLQAYSIFAYDGKYCEMASIENTQTPCVRKIDKKYTDMITSILSDRYSKLPGFPLNSSLDFPDRWVALKTGTSRNFRDNWTLGFTDHYMIGVWTGNKNGENMKWVSGATGAGEIFARIVYFLEQNESTPSVLQKERISKPFLEITSPLGGSLYKIDELKSNDLQKIKLKFSTNLDYDKSYWILDEKRISEELINLIPWDHVVEVVIEKNWKEIMRKKNIYKVTK